VLGIRTFRETLQTLISKFEKDRTHYLSRGYLEAQVRIDFINPFFNALGWDIENRAQKPPHERDVIVELSPETTGRPDYNFRLNGATKFFVEAKAPSVPLDDVNHILQAKSYAWSTKEVYFVVLTDFEEFRLYDASLKPNPRFPDEGLIFDLKYTDYLPNIEKLWELSRERVEQGSLEALLPKDTKSKRLRIPPDKSFLEDLTNWRTELAKDIYKRNPEINIKLLNDAVQRLLDRIVFIRIAEDRKIRPDRELWEIVAQWKEEGRRKPIMTHLKDLFKEINDDLNGDIFKPHACEQIDVSSNLLAEIIESLYFPKSRYRFDAIGVELLGSIYERYLGSTIRVTPQRVKVEEKPEVRKAGGVYYTPKYIVDYIVKNTVGKVIEGKTPKQIEKIKILDPACGSGSFLLGAYQYLIDYHLKYYREHPKEAQTLHLFPYWKVSPEEFTLPLHEKAKILRNNIFGVDIDPQAVEITMMSLYLKALEGERGLLPKKQHLLPPLSNNIKCGNSLIGYDIFDNPFQPPLTSRGGDNSPLPPLKIRGGRGSYDSPELSDEDKSRINPFDWNSKTAGFGEIMENGGFDVVIGNPPYVNVENVEPVIRKLLMNSYKTAVKRFDIYIAFIEKGLHLSRQEGLLSFIIPYPFINQNYAEPLRRYLVDSYKIKLIADLSNIKVFEDAVVRNCVIVIENSKPKKNKVEIVSPKNVGEAIALSNLLPKNLNQTDFKKFPKHMFRLDISSEIFSIIQKIEKSSIRLGEICYVNWGARSGNVKKYVTSRPIDKYSRKMINARDIDRYSLVFDHKFLRYKKEELYNPMFEELFENPKLIVRDISGKERLKATFDEENYYAEHTVSLCVPKYLLANVNRKGLHISRAEIEESKKWNLKFILGIFNSKLITAYFKWLLGGGLHVYPDDVKNIPLFKIDLSNPSEKALHDKLVSLVDRMLELHKKKNSLPPSAERDKIEREIAVTDEKIDEIVYGLYGITEEERRIIEGD